MKKLTSFFFALVMIQNMSFAGQEGHGGVGVVCRENGAIKSVEMLDLFEGRALYNLDIPTSSNDSDAQLTELFARLDDKLGMGNVQSKELSLMVKVVKRDFQFLPDGVGVETVNDAFPVVKKKGCQFEQIAVYRHNGVLSVDKELFQHLDSTNRAAFYLHEAAYKFARLDHPTQSSLDSRKFVAYAFSPKVSHREVLYVADVAFDYPRATPFSDTPSTSPDIYERLDYALEMRTLTCKGKDYDKSEAVFTVSIVKNPTSGLTVNFQNVKRGMIGDLAGTGAESWIKDEKWYSKYQDDGSYTFSVALWKLKEPFNYKQIDGVVDSEWDDNHIYYPVVCSYEK